MIIYDSEIDIDLFAVFQIILYLLISGVLLVICNHIAEQMISLRHPMKIEL